MTSPDPRAAMRAGIGGLAPARARLSAFARGIPWSWLLLPFLVAGLDATRGVTAALVIGAVVVLLVLPLASHGAADAAALQPTVPPPTTWLAIAIGTVTGSLLLALAGATAAATVTVAAVAAVVTWQVARARLALGRPRMATLLASIDALLAPAAMGGVAAIAGAVLPPADGAPADPGGVPWAWVLAFVAWSVGTQAVTLAGGRRVITLGRVAVLAYAAACATAATQGILGMLAAAALLLPVAVGAMVLGPHASRTPHERRILDRLLGPWLVVLLLAEWRILPVDPWLVAIVASTGVSGHLLASVVMLRLATRRRRSRGPVDAAADDPSLVIVLPLVRSVPDLREVVLSLRSQTYADTRVLVVALPGVDITAADEWLGAEAVQQTTTPPPGRGAFGWAREAGLASVHADLALVVDPATTLAPVAARVLVEHLIATRVDAIGAAPRTALPTLGDRVAGAGPGLWRSGIEPRWFVALTRGRPARLVGPDPAVVLLRLAALRATEDRRPGRPIPDDGLLRALADDGRRIGLVHAGDLARRRADTSVRGMVRWWRHMAPRLAGGTVADLAAMLVVLTGGLLGPVLLPIAAWASGADVPVVLAAGLPLVILLVARVLHVITQRGSLRALAWHPATVVVAIFGVIRALVDHVGLTGDPTVVDARLAGDATERVVRSRT